MHTHVLATAGTPFPGSAFEAPIFRIPALTVTTRRRILVAYDVREDWRDLPADFDVALRHSDDGGMSWSDARPLRAHSPGHGFGDASLLTDPATGHVHCWYVGSTGESYFSARPDAPGLELWLATSTDEGETWTHRNLSHLRPPGVAGMFCASGNGAVLADGTLLQPFVARIGGANWALCARSEDHGLTWTMGAPVGPDCDEWKVVGLAPAGVSRSRALMHARATPARRQAFSDDAGATFSAPMPVSALVDPGCNGGLVRVGDVLVASMCDDPQGRGRLSLHVSEDEGVTWGPAVLVDRGAAAYSVLAALDQRTLVLAWEADNYQRIVVATIDLDEIGVGVGEKKGAAAPNLVPRAGTPGFALPPVVNPRSGEADPAGSWSTREALAVPRVEEGAGRWDL
ncbi:exo-alpha-sialidase [Schaalia sp. 19OD2882]|uniref:sialidase family protein n=1 Tax=Schaalia sp. 19OD2882 TaxID=2794089 RepID=UPI001C1EA679|nr:sialidase family protein [Schaalia sp. 19OD2882]QWW19518.1 exo-alpha-sialidase [Schaalia sp. 19OD2882]